MEPISKINPLDFPICLERPLWREPASNWLEHVPFGMFLIDLLRPGLLVELGTCDGVSYGAFCQAVRQLGAGTQCFGIHAAGQAGSGACSPERIGEFRSFHDPLYAGFSRLLPDQGETSLGTFPDGSIDLLHIQDPGSHAAAKNLFETWLPKLSDHSVALLSGINLPGDDLGVRAFWQELKNKYPGFEFHHSGGLGIATVGTKIPEQLRGLIDASPAGQQRTRDFFHRLGEEIKLDFSLDEARHELADSQGHRDSLQGQLAQTARLSRQLSDLRAQMTALQDGPAYRLSSRLVSFLGIFLPVGTVRRRLVVGFARSVSSLFKKGWSGLWRFSGVPGANETGNAGLGRAAVDDRTPPASKPADTETEQNSYKAVYSSLLNTSMRQGNPEYVGLSDVPFPPADRLVKLIAYYLPQFHPIPENDLWWGRGFTEWSNVVKAVPQFEGHYQPHLPGELGFYDLRLPEVQRRQVELARQYGIHGFCFHYYWFEGKRLLERPLDQFLNDPEIDFPFCICWANENWTRRWDGREDEILIGQEHSVAGDIGFIRDVTSLFQHKNYIHIAGRPLLVVYRPNILPDPRGTAERWRETCESTGIGNPYLIAAQSFGLMDPVEVGFDAAVEFPPHNRAQVDIKGHLKMLNPEHAGTIFDYTSAARSFSNLPVEPGYKLFRTVSPGWDNEPRKPGKGLTFAFSTPLAYRQWLEEVCRYAVKAEDPDERIVFINAWNEWGEGAHLEPDRKYGYAYLQATADALKALRAAS